ncbi:LURP-one-related family protein [Sulfurimonas sp. MAG313]|nr:LURP-one-related family protein [Sulfurimonas sp. MAG313]MDF1879821.1 LURP-one-related family protein [Sulfurimonas sp. MAG313]
MSKALSISNKIMSLKGRILITDLEDNLCYDAKGNFSFFRNKKWSVTQDENEVFSIRKKVFSWSPTYMVNSKIGNFYLKRKTLSLKRKYFVHDGKYKGTTAEGSFWDQNFTLRSKEKVIAKVNSKLFTLRDRHAVELVDETSEAELMTVIFMVMNQLEKAREAQQQKQKKLQQQKSKKK